MGIAGNPKKLAQDIAEGFLLVSPPQLKLYSPADIKVLLANIAMVARDLRQIQIPLDDILALKQRNTRLTRLNQAETLIRAHCKKHRLPI